MTSFFEDIIMLNAKDYFDSVLNVYVNLIVFIIAAALCASSFVINHHKTYTLRMIKQLLRHKAFDEEGSNTLAELHLLESRSLKWALSRKGQLTNVVKRVGQPEYSYEEYVKLQKEKKLPKEKIDFSTAKFFIPKEKLDRARTIEEKENPTILRTVLVCFLIIALAMCIALLMPELLSLMVKATA